MILDRHNEILVRYNGIVDHYNGLVDRYNKILYRYYEILDRYNGILYRYSGSVNVIRDWKKILLSLCFGCFFSLNYPRMYWYLGGCRALILKNWKKSKWLTQNYYAFANSSYLKSPSQTITHRDNYLMAHLFIMHIRQWSVIIYLLTCILHNGGGGHIQLQGGGGRVFF